MSVTEKLTLLLNIKEDIKDALSYKAGYDVGDRIAQYGDIIRGLMAGAGLCYEGFMTIKLLTANDIISGTFLRYVHSDEIELVTQRGMNYNPNLESIILPRCASVEDYAFDHCTGLTEVILENCKSLGEGAFLNCEALPNITLNNVTTLPVNAFKDCANLELYGSIVTEIGNNAFLNCTKLTSIDTSAVTKFGNSCFNNCKALTNIDVSNADSIGNSAFSGSPIELISLKEGVSIGSSAFSGTSLTYVDLSKASSVGGSAFNDCSFLENVNLTGIQTLEGSLFRNCWSLRLLEIPDTVTAIKANNTFAYCYSMMSIYLPHSRPPALGNMSAKADDTGHYTIIPNSLIFVPDDKLTLYKNTYHWEDYYNYGRVRGISEYNNLALYNQDGNTKTGAYIIRNTTVNGGANLSKIAPGHTLVFVPSSWERTSLGSTYGNTLLVFNRNGAANPYWSDTRFTLLEIPTDIKSYKVTWDSNLCKLMSLYLMAELNRFCFDDNISNGFTHNFNNNDIKKLASYNHLWVAIVLKFIPKNNFSITDLNLQFTFTMSDDSEVTYNIE